MNEREQLEQAMAVLEGQRATVGDETVEVALAPIRKRLAELERRHIPTTSLQGERKLVTVMFAKISGLAALTETMNPEAAHNLVNACFRQLTPVIEKYEGTVHKFISGEILVLFGVPVVHENDPERALRTALEMMRALAKFNTSCDVELGLRVGVSTGMVITGGIGIGGQQEYSVVGNAVNQASWLGEIAEIGEVLVGADTYRLTAQLFNLKLLDPIIVKGQAEPLSVYRLLTPKVVTGILRSTGGLESPLVGRHFELESLLKALENLQVGRGGIVTVVGEAGLGKSRLVTELCQRARPQLASSNLRWLEGRCQSFGSSIAYSLWSDLLRGLLGMTAEDFATQVRDALREHVRDVCPERFKVVYPYLGWLMGLPLEAEFAAQIQALDGESLKRNVFGAVSVLVQDTARRKPVIIVCEDLHWSDPTSVELLDQLLVLTELVPLLLVCVFRPQRGASGWRVWESASKLYDNLHTDIWLNPLNSAESEDLVINLLRVEGVSQKLQARILQRAEGNPLYMEEILRSLIDSKAIKRDKETKRWRVARDVDEIAIPDTLHGVLMARIDQLPESAKRVLQLAAVVGRVFTHQVMMALTSGAAVSWEAQDLPDLLVILQRESMIFERARIPEREYAFKHHLLQEATYNSLVDRERRIFHRQVAQALHFLFGERIDEMVGLLAYHWERSDKPERATEYLLLAGDQARLLYAHEEAIGYYQRALKFLEQQESHEQAARTLMKLGLTFHIALDFKSAREAYEGGFALWQLAAEVQPDEPPALASRPLKVAWVDPTNLDPTKAQDAYSSCVIDQLFSGLVELSPELGIVPAVVHTWDVLDGGRRYVFRLRQDASWSDGVPVTAGDFEYAWKRVLDPNTESVAASLLYDIKGAKAFHQGETIDSSEVGVKSLDDVTLQVELDSPSSYFPHLLTYHPTFPLPRHVLSTSGDVWTENLVTNGPFRVEGWQLGESMCLVRSESYRGRSRGNVQRVQLSLIPDRSMHLEMYDADQLDVLDLGLLPPGERDRARQRHAGDYISVPSLVTVFVGLVTRPPFDSVEVRRAFALATDKEDLADVFLNGYEFPATGGFVPPRMPGHSPSIGLSYNPQRARQLLAKAGYPQGQGFPVVNAFTPGGLAPVSEHLQKQWQESLGVAIKWQTMDWKSFVKELDRGSLNMFVVGWSAPYPDPDNFLRTSPAWQYTLWQNEDYTHLVEQARQVTDQGERINLYQRADKILVEEAPIIPLTYRRLHLLVKPWVRKYPTSAIKYWFWKDVVIE